MNVIKKYIVLLVCIFGFLNSPLMADTSDEMIELLNYAIECGDIKLAKEVIEALLTMESSNKDLLDALAKYSEKGKIDFALYNAISNNNLFASVILAHYTKDVNARKPGEECVYATNNNKDTRVLKNPLERSLDVGMKGIIPYLLMIKNANPYLMRPLGFIYEEENSDSIKQFGVHSQRTSKSDQKYYLVNNNFQRSFIGDIIAKNQLDILELVEKTKKVDLNKACCIIGNGVNFTPLQYALAIQRYEIAQFLIDHGVKIE